MSKAIRVREDLTGRRFGKLEVIRIDGRMGSIVAYLCKCDCGTEKRIRATSLKSGASKSCGCGVSAERDLIGERFGRILVLARGEKIHKTRLWWIRCDCGTERWTRGDAMMEGGTQSCGCLMRESRGKSNRTHGRSGTTEHRTWKRMRSRCHDAKDRAFVKYGARGIYVCQRWRESFAAFFADMGERPADKTSIDRFPDNTGSYTCGNHALCPDCAARNAPFNCRWADAFEQSRNRGVNIVVTAFGETHCAGEWANRYGMDQGTLIRRLHCGESLESAIARPVGRWQRMTPDVVRSVRARLANGETAEHIASDIEYSTSAVEAIRDGKTWRDVT